MSLQPTVYIDLNEFIPQPPKRNRCREDPLALDDVILIKEEPLDEYPPELPKSPTEKSLGPVEFVDMGPPQIKLEGFEATPVSVQTRTCLDPLDPENFEIKIENYEDLANMDLNSGSERQDENTSDSGNFIPSIFKLKKIPLRQLKPTDQPSRVNNVTAVSIESTSNLTDINQLKDVNSVNANVDSDSSNTVSKVVALNKNSLNNDSNQNLPTTLIDPTVDSLVNSDALNLSGENICLPENLNDVSSVQTSTIQQYDSSENSRDNCNNSVYNEEKGTNENTSNNDVIVSNSEKNKNLSVYKKRGLSKPDKKRGLSKPDKKRGLSKPDKKHALSKPDKKRALSKPDNPQGGKKRKVSLDSQVNYDKPSNSCRRSRNSLLSALDNNIEPESFKAILEKLLVPENEIRIESSQDVSESQIKSVKCKRKSMFENSCNNKISTKINKSVIGKDGTKSKNFICSSNDPQLVEISTHIYPIKNCTVVLERLNLSETSINDVDPKNKNKCIDNNISNKESKLLSLQLYKEIPNVPSEKLKVNGFRKSKKAVALKESKKFTDELISDDQLLESFSFENVFSNSTNEITNKITRKKRSKTMRIKNSIPEIKRNLRVKSSKNYVDYEENEDLSNCENLTKNIKSHKNSSNHIIKRKKVIKTKGAKQMKSRKKINVNKGKNVKKSRRKEIGINGSETLKATKNSNDSEVNLSVHMNNLNENDELSDSHNNKSESDIDEPDDNKDPDWLEDNNISGYISENGDNTELLTCDMDSIVDSVIGEIKPIFAINFKEDGKHKVTKNHQVMTQVKRKLIKELKSLFHGADFRSTLQPHFKTTIENILKDIGISFSQNTEDGKEIFKCLFCDYSTEIECRFIKHLWLHLARYRCPYCNYENEFSAKIKRHMSKHGIRLSFNCKVCSFVTDDKEKLKEHEKLNHDDPKPFKCTQCEYKTPIKFRLNRHIEYKHNLNKIKEFICDICNFGFSEKYYLVRHMKCHDDKVQKYVCRICGYRAKKLINSKNNFLLSGKDNLIKHMMKVHNEKLYNCNLCKYTTNENYILKHHIKTVHHKIFSLSCDKCNFKTSCKNQLQVHINNVHNKIKAFVCHICNIKIGRKNDLDYHILQVHEKSTVYNCEYCPYTTARKGDLKSHKTVWHAPKNNTYKCFYCSFSGHSKKSIKNHIRRKHDIKKPYFCIYCKFKTTTEESLEEHVTRHSKYKPFKCPHCSYMSKRKNTLKQHILGKHERTRPFVCYYCQWGSHRKDHVRRHIWGRHKFGKYTTDTPIYNIGQLNEHEVRRQMYLDISRTKLNKLPPKQSQNIVSNDRNLSQKQDENILFDQQIQKYVLQYGAQSKEIQEDNSQSQEIQQQDVTGSNEIQNISQGQDVHQDAIKSKPLLDLQIQKYVLQYGAQSKEIQEDNSQSQDIEKDVAQNKEIQQDISQGQEIQQQDVTGSNQIQNIWHGQHFHQDATKSNLVQDVLQGQDIHQDAIKSKPLLDLQIQKYVLQYGAQSKEIQEDNLQCLEIEKDVAQNKEIQQDISQGQEIQQQDVTGNNQIQNIWHGQHFHQDATKSNLGQDVLQGQDIHQDATKSKTLLDLQIQKYVLQYGAQSKEIQEDNLQCLEIEKDVAQNKEIQQDISQGQDIQQQDRTGSNQIQNILHGQNFHQDATKSNLGQDVLQGQDIHQDATKSKTLLDLQIQKYVLQYGAQSKEIQEDNSQSQEIEKDVAQNKEIQQDISQGQEIQLQDVTGSNEIQNVLHGQHFHQDATKSNVIQDDLQDQEIHQDATKSNVVQDVLQDQEIHQDLTKNIGIQDVLLGQEIHKDATKSNGVQDVLQDQEIHQDATKSNGVQDVLLGEEIHKDATKSNGVQDVSQCQEIHKSNVVQDVLQDQEIHQDATKSNGVQDVLQDQEINKSNGVHEVLQGQDIHQDATKNNGIQDVLQDQEIHQDATKSNGVQDVLQDQEINKSNGVQDVLLGEEIHKDATKSNGVQDVSQGQESIE